MEWLLCNCGLPAGLEGGAAAATYEDLTSLQQHLLQYSGQPCAQHPATAATDLQASAGTSLDASALGISGSSIESLVNGGLANSLDKSL